MSPAKTHPEGPCKIVVVGGGTAGWMAAAALVKFLGRTVDVTLVESDAIGIVGVGEATIPQIRNLNRALEIDEAEFVAGTNGSFKLGIEFVNWRRQGHSYFHNFSKIGLAVNQVQFHHHLFRAQAEGIGGALWDYCVNTHAARAGRFAPVEKLGTSRLAGIGHAYHFDAALYGRFLRRYAEAHGAKRVEGRIVDVHQDAETGDVASVRLEGDRAVEGEIFIDCSGFRGLLIEGALKTGYEDWSHWLKCDSALAVPSRNTRPPRPYTQAIAHDAGWQWRIPLQHRTGNGHVFSSAYTDNDAARETLLKNLEGEALAEPRLINFTTGRRKQFWNRNVVALGLASGFLEPLESTSIHLVQSGISRFIQMFPARPIYEAEREEYNAQTVIEFERIRDFLILHYHLNERADSQFWVDVREMDVPEPLQRKLDLFKGSGRIYRGPHDLFTEDSWLQVMHGQGLTPETWHPLADRLSRAELEEMLANIRRIVTTAASRLPAHGDFVSGCCAAPKAAE
jgi:tryptophan halogenase